MQTDYCLGSTKWEKKLDNEHDNSLVLSECEIRETEKLLLPAGSTFSEEAREIIRRWDSFEVLACPGSGKTTVLLAKLKMLANRMPLKNGAGICVLSHTNVAVDEIKARMKDDAKKLLGYPNFIGTLQVFIDKYITLPYIRTLTSAPIQFVDNATYSLQLWKLINSSRSYSTIKGFLYNKVAQSRDRFQNETEYLQQVYHKDDGLYFGQNTRLAGNTSSSFLQYKAATEQLLKEYGVLKYSDAYDYANYAMDSLDLSYIDLFNCRFAYVFIDEYQDCSEMQREAIDRIFDPEKCTIIKIGDVDQSIFNGKNAVCLWEPKDGALPLSCSNRYGQEIANIITPLKTREGIILSSRGETGFKPTLIVFSDNTRSKVIETFISALDKNGLTETNGVYKAIGKIVNLDGLNIKDYWSEYNSEKSSNIGRYWNYVDKIAEALSGGKLYKAEILVRKLFFRVFHFLEKRDDAGRWYTVTSIKKRLDTTYFDDYRSEILKFTMLVNFDRKTVDAQIKILFNAILGLDKKGKSIFEHMPAYFMADTAMPTVTKIDNNTFTDSIGRKIKFDTVHGVKGETHDATLYMETKENRSTDLKRVLPILEGKPFTTNPTIDYARRCIYVGLSRPRKLLCVAMMGDTYSGHEKVFANWDVIDIR